MWQAAGGGEGGSAGRHGGGVRVESAMNGLAVEGWASLCARPVRPGSAEKANTILLGLGTKTHYSLDVGPFGGASYLTRLVEAQKTEPCLILSY